VSKKGISLTTANHRADQLLEIILLMINLIVLHINKQLSQTDPITRLSRTHLMSSGQTVKSTWIIVIFWIRRSFRISHSRWKLDSSLISRPSLGCE